MLSTKVTKRIEGLPLSLPPSSICYSGGIQTRGVRALAPGKTLAPPPLSAEDRIKIQEAKKIYQDLRKKSPPDDPTPELYFLGVLAEYKQYPEMEKIINTMQIKRPGDATLKDLKAWVRSQSVSSE